MHTQRFNEHIRQQLTYHRRAAGHTIQYMAALLHLPEAQYRSIEDGTRPDIGVTLVNDFCAALRITIPNFLLAGKTTRTVFAALIIGQWDLICQLYESEQQMQELIACLGG